MPDGSNGPSLGSTVSSENPGLVPNQLAVLVPTFDPAKDDVMVYSHKIPITDPGMAWRMLATRLILGCSGSAFMKLQIHQAEVTKNEKKSIEKMITILGGQWGQINLEKQYEYAEKAIYRCYQKSDESADSYLARADILWSELQAEGVPLEDLQPYVTLRGSQLTLEDKKKVLIDVDAANTGKLTIAKACECLLSIDTEPSALEGNLDNLAWRCEVLISEDDIQAWKDEEPNGSHFCCFSRKTTAFWNQAVYIVIPGTTGVPEGQGKRNPELVENRNCVHWS